MKTPKRALHSQRGSALIVALLLTIGLAVMLASYHSLIHFNLRASHRSYHSSAAMNLAETGLEEGMYAINKKRANPLYTYVSDGWTVVGDTATREFSNTFAVGTSSETYVKVQITNCNLTLPYPARPTIKTQARLSLPNGMPAVTKWVEVTLDAPSSSTPNEQGPPHPGLVAKRAIKFNGNNPTVDSWNSDPAKTGVMTHRYDSTTKNDEGFVGSIDVAVDQLTIQNADIKGHVATNTDTDLSNNVGPNGSILADDSPAGTKIDPNRVSTDFTATLPEVTAPTVIFNVLGPISDSISLPRVGDLPAADGKYYYQTGNIQLNNKTLSVTSQDVVISAPYPYDIKVGGGSGAITIATGASLEIYAGRDVDISGQGVANGSSENVADTQQPSKFKIWGTGTSNTTQDIKISGNGALSGVIYAPNANVTITGGGASGGDVMGSVVANNITISGNAQFHYDESLGQFAFGTPADSGDSALTIYRWRELIAASETTW